MSKQSPQVIAAWIAGAAAVVVALITAAVTIGNGKSPPTPSLPTRATTVTASESGHAVAITDTKDSTIVINPAHKDAKPGRLEVADILVDCYRKDFNAELDFRVVNRGEKPLSISRLRLKVLSVKEVNTAGFLKFSAKYDLDISDVTKVGDIREIAISHELAPGETDRFAVNLTARKMSIGLFRIWQFETTVVTSEGEVIAKPIDVGLPWDIRKTSKHPHFSDEAKGVSPDADDESDR